MVSTKERFCVELVDAETKKPLKEFETNSGLRTYVEAEPGLEYYIRVKVLSGKDPIFISFRVDGQDLEHTLTRTFGDGEDIVGADYTITNEFSVSKAFRFEAPKTVPTPTPSRRRSSLAFLSGSVRVTFAKARRSRNRIRDWEYHPNNDPSVKLPNLPPSSKILRSQPGSHLHVEEYGAPSEYYQGAVLATITINYCSALGLIHAGILPEPPGWESARRWESSRKKEMDPAIAALVPIQVRSDGGTLEKLQFGLPGTVCDLYDLTHLDFPDVEDGSDANTEANPTARLVSKNQKKDKSTKFLNVPHEDTPNSTRSARLTVCRILESCLSPNNTGNYLGSKKKKDKFIELEPNDKDRNNGIDSDHLDRRPTVHTSSYPPSHKTDCQRDVVRNRKPECKQEHQSIELKGEPDEDKKAKGAASNRLNMKRILRSSLRKPKDERQRCVDRCFLKHYHGMPELLFIKTYTRETIWRRLGRSFLSSNAKRRIHERIMAWETAVCRETIRI